MKVLYIFKNVLYIIVHPAHYWMTSNISAGIQFSSPALQEMPEIKLWVSYHKGVQKDL